MNVVRFPIKVKIHKSGDMVYFSQLDMVSILERALRRASLPVYFTQGFNPRIKLSFHSALKLGVEGEIETTFNFTEPVSFERLAKELTPQLPVGLALGNS